MARKAGVCPCRLPMSSQKTARSSSPRLTPTSASAPSLRKFCAPPSQHPTANTKQDCHGDLVRRGGNLRPPLPLYLDPSWEPSIGSLHPASELRFHLGRSNSPQRKHLAPRQFPADQLD